MLNAQYEVGFGVFRRMIKRAFYLAAPRPQVLSVHLPFSFGGQFISNFYPIPEDREWRKFSHEYKANL
jgi:hypothetical protein